MPLSFAVSRSTCRLSEDHDMSVMPASFRVDPEAALAGFQERGFHLEPDLVPVEMCDRLLRTASELPGARDGTFRPIPMPHRVAPDFLDMMRFREIVKIVEIIVDGRVSGLGGDFSYMRPGTPGWLIHQDNFYIQAPPDKLVSVWTALCDVGPENGGLVLYPGTHRLGILPIERLEQSTDAGQHPSAAAIRALLPGDFATFSPRMRKGTSLFFHSQLVHGSHQNKSSGFRYSYLKTYIRSGSPFRPGTMQKRTEINLY